MKTIGAHVEGLRFASGSKFQSEPSGWQHFLFAVSDYENGCVYDFYQEIIMAIKCSYTIFHKMEIVIKITVEEC